MSNLLKLALFYAAQGFHVFPLRPLSKIPATSNGFHAATTDPDTIAAWWEDNPDYNIGIRTGKESGITVIDLDGLTGYSMFEQALSAFEDSVSDNIGWPTTLTVKTPGGYHLYFNYDEGLRQTAGLLPNVDVRNDGGYVVAPGSRIDPGAGVKEYNINTDAPIAPLPTWIIDLQNQRRKPTPKEGHVTSEEGIGEGGRNAYLTKVGGALRRQGIDQEAIEAALISINESVCDPPLEDHEVLMVARSVSRYEPDPDEIPQSTIVPAKDLVQGVHKYLNNPDLTKGEPTGIEGLDNLLGGGLKPGVHVLQAEAKTGKNTVWHRPMLNFLERGLAYGYGSFEISPEQEVLPDLLSKYYQRNGWNKPFTEEEITEPLTKWPLYFCAGDGYVPVDQLKTWVTNLNQQHGVKYFFLDHLHYMLEDEEWLAAAKLIKTVKTLSRRLDVCVVLIVQPTKTGKDQSLGLGTLKGGSAIGQAIDTLMVLDYVYETEEGSFEKKEVKNVRKLSVVAARHKLSKKGSIYLQYNPETTDVVEVEKEEEKPSPPQRTFDSFNRSTGYTDSLYEKAKKFEVYKDLKERPGIPPSLSD